MAVFGLPSLLLAVIWIVVPFVMLFVLSLYKTDFIDYQFIGFGNYLKMWTNKATMQSILNTCVYTLLIVPFNMVIALTISLGLYDKSKKIQDIQRFLYYVPTLASGVIIANFWKWFFANNGGVNALLSLIGITPVLWFGSGMTAIPAISSMIVIQNIGGIIVVLSGAVLSIDKHTIDASRIDGCTDRQTRWLVMFPQIKSSVLAMLFLAVVGVWQMFETVYTVAPYEYSSTIMFRVYEVGFQNGRYGEASALSVLLVGVVSLLTITSKKLVKL